MLDAIGSYPPALGPGPPSHQPSETATPRVLSILSGVLERLVARNDRLLASQRFDSDKSLKGFHGARAPAISIPKYLERIYKYTGCSPACFVVGYVYIDRLIHRHPESLVVSLNVHRLLVTSVMVAAKMLDDAHYNNGFYARVGGISNAELNRLEIELLFLLDFGVVVSSRVFESYCLHLERDELVNGSEGMNRIDRALALPSSITAEDVPEIPADNNTAAKGI
ncbi:hypothetical protein SAY87_027230 [Trapa incisa]|uniref:Cyclin n=2 Tax=Trapa TaxID=22665 RepID=A0AAN7RI69_TRANT|nr:hypothetical protein SAY87_027230 [Trapa incisa]KAK4799246.1 hypothetical protein SAY86_024611 [Trapa natans]